MLIFTKLRGSSTTESPFRPAALVPAFRCETWIADVVRGLLRHVPEVLVVDDGSEDLTFEAARGAGAKVHRREANGGKGRALREGLGLLLAGEWTHVAFVDGDGQHDPDDLPALLAAARGGADFVIGSRLSDPEGMPALRLLWVEAMRTRGLSEAHVDNCQMTLAAFILWAQERGVTKAREVTRPVLES